MYNPNTDLELDQDPDPELTSPNCPHFGIHIVIKTLDGSSCKKCIISASATYIQHTCEKVKKQNSQQKMELINNGE